MFSRLLPVAVLMVGLPALVYGQNNYQRRPQQSGRQPGMMQPGMQQPIIQQVEIEGTVQGVTRGAIMVLDGKGQSWHVGVPQTAKVQVSGTATADYLQAGMIVEFQAEIDDRGAIKEKVGDLSIVTHSSEKQTGLFPTDGGAADAAGAGGGKSVKPAKGAAGKGATSKTVAAGTYRVVGKLAVTRGKFLVHAGRNMLSLELTEQPTIKFEMADYTRAANGDKISVKGIRATSRTGVAVAAAEVRIELAEPLAGAKRKGSAAKSEAKRPAKQVKKDEGQPAAVDEK